MTTQAQSIDLEKLISDSADQYGIDKPALRALVYNYPSDLTTGKQDVEQIVNGLAGSYAEEYKKTGDKQSAAAWALGIKDITLPENKAIIDKFNSLYKRSDILYGLYGGTLMPLIVDTVPSEQTQTDQKAKVATTINWARIKKANFIILVLAAIFLFGFSLLQIAARDIKIQVAK